MSRTKLIAFIVATACCLSAQEVTFRGRVDVVHRSNRKAGSSEVVVWLTGSSIVPAATTASTARLTQRDKRFSPHLVAVQVGTEIEFPNQDPFFHDVFSIYRGKPFDLGLYESGSSRKVRFSQPGVSYIFCNIHPEMSAAVVALSTPYFAVTSSDGSFQIKGVPQGHYKMEFWYELASESELSSLTHDVEVRSEQQPLVVTLHSSDVPAQHLNKYGQEYSAEKPKSY